MLQPILLSPSGARFRREVQAAGRPLFAWTVNAPNVMRWCIRKRIDGVLTDDPKQFREVCEAWDEESDKGDRFTWRQWVAFALLNLVSFLVGIVLRWKKPADIVKFMKRLTRQPT